MDQPDVVFKPVSALKHESTFALFTSEDGTQLVRIDNLEAVCIGVAPEGWRRPKRVVLMVRFQDRAGWDFTMRDIPQAERAAQAIRGHLNTSKL